MSIGLCFAKDCRADATQLCDRGHVQTCHVHGPPECRLCQAKEIRMIATVEPLSEQLERMNRLLDQAVKRAVAAERKRCFDIADNYADVEGDSEHLRPNTAMRIAQEIEGEGY